MLIYCLVHRVGLKEKFRYYLALVLSNDLLILKTANPSVENYSGLVNSISYRLSHQPMTSGELRGAGGGGLQLISRFW